MTKPHLPKTLEEALVDLLESIALEETAIANMLNAETEKIKAINLEKETLQDVIKFQDTVHKLAKTLIKYQILLQFKLEIVENTIPRPLPPPEPPHRKVITIEQVAVLAIYLIEKSTSSEKILCSFSETITEYSNLLLYVPLPGKYYGPEGGPFVHSKIVNAVCYCNYVLDPVGAPTGDIICTLKLCKIVAVTALVNLLVSTSGYCQPLQCETGP